MKNARHRFWVSPWILLLPLVLATGRGCRFPEAKAPEAPDFEVERFVPLAGLQPTDNPNVFRVEVDYSDAGGGLAIPSHRQEPSALHYSFQIKNTGTKPRTFRYKIYYQNESYKFPEMLTGGGKREHPRAADNFYGSWDNAEGYRQTTLIPADGAFHPVRGTLSIQGNPRDEEKYFSNGINQRWKRNPRMGKYSFLLVVTAEDDLSAAVPDYLQNLALRQNQRFVNPYGYFVFGEGSRTSGLRCVASSDTLLAVSRLPLAAGVFVDPADFSAEQLAQFGQPRCGAGEDLRKKAVFKQFIHHVDSSSVFNNIPVLADVTGDAYTLREYNYHKAFCRPGDYVRTRPVTADCPCSSVPVDTVKHSISLINPAADSLRLRKQNAGIITRFGLTYGTYTVKVRLPQLLNKQGIWNGITNAIWLITQSYEPWNARSTCGKEGYISDYYSSDHQREATTSYSEIDFEILKTGPYCPEYAYTPYPLQPFPSAAHRAWWNLPYPGEGPGAADEIMVCCTNWDMACPEPENYGVGCQDLTYNGQAFSNHRWDYWYKALTSKYPASDDELFAGPYYYFQIVWRPYEILWKIGPERDQLRLVGYMNAGITNIPDNQMSLIISQEFHNTAWWPGSPFAQSHIPFPSQDIVGEVLDVTIE